MDRVAKTPLYLDDFSIVRPGYHDGGEGKRLLYVGPEPRIAEPGETINRFLDVMDFASNADRTNTVAAALTVWSRKRACPGTANGVAKTPGGTAQRLRLLPWPCLLSAS